MRLSHSFSPHYSDQYHPPMDHYFDSRDVMKVDTYEDYEASSSDAYTEELRIIVNKFTATQQKCKEDLYAQLSMIEDDLGAKLSSLSDRLDQVEIRYSKISKDLFENKQDIQRNMKKITNVAYAVDRVEEQLGVKIEALQKGFTDPQEYISWKDDQEYPAVDSEEEERKLRK